MKKKLIRTGNSAALVIEKATMEAMGLDANSPVMVHFDGEKLTVQAAPGTRELLVKLVEISEANQHLLKNLLEQLKHFDAQSGRIENSHLDEKQHKK